LYAAFFFLLSFLPFQKSHITFSFLFQFGTSPFSSFFFFRQQVVLCPLLFFVMGRSGRGSAFFTLFLLLGHKILSSNFYQEIKSPPASSPLSGFPFLPPEKEGISELTSTSDPPHCSSLRSRCSSGPGNVFAFFAFFPPAAAYHPFPYRYLNGRPEFSSPSPSY